MSRAGTTLRKHAALIVLLQERPRSVVTLARLSGAHKETVRSFLHALHGEKLIVVSLVGLTPHFAWRSSTDVVQPDAIPFVSKPGIIYERYNPQT